MALREIATTIEIAAPPVVVWRILTDFDAYPDWNTFVTGIAGKLARDARLAVRIALPGGKIMILRPRVLAVEPERRLCWKGRLFLPGLFDGEHEFRLEPKPGGVRFHHGEIFGGLFVSMLPARTFATFESGFVAMNRALKTRAELIARTGTSNASRGSA